MELHYNKNDNSTLFKDFKNSSLVNVNDPQSFIPLYTKFFSLNDTNYNHINLNHNDSDSIIITNQYGMNINITLNSNIVGTTYKIIISNIQSSLKISSLNVGFYIVVIIFDEYCMIWFEI